MSSEEDIYRLGVLLCSLLLESLLSGAIVAVSWQGYESLYRLDDLLKRCRILGIVFVVRSDNCLLQLFVIKTSVICEIVLLTYQQGVPLINHIEIAGVCEPSVTQDLKAVYCKEMVRRG